jgi:hypothetical protein
MASKKKTRAPANEAWHMVQQQRGRVRPATPPDTETPVNDDLKLEREADREGCTGVAIRPRQRRVTGSSLASAVRQSVAE